MPNLYIYVVDRDLGFAPNPFHGSCTLATCKPHIRRTAQINDWIMGVGGGKLKATGKCVYLMKVTEILTFNGYSDDVRFQKKKPLRNGSLVMMVGDNIYYKHGDGLWSQRDSHHSNADGSVNMDNLKRDTSSDKVLISRHFYYFGASAPDINLDSISYKNRRAHDKRALTRPDVIRFIEEFESIHKNNLNMVNGDPYHFSSARKRVNQMTGKMF